MDIQTICTVIGLLAATASVGYSFGARAGLSDLVRRQAESEHQIKAILEALARIEKDMPTRQTLTDSIKVAVLEHHRDCKGV